MERLSMEEIKVLKDTIGFRVDKIKADGSFKSKRNIFCVVKEDIQDTPLNRINRDLMEKVHYLAKIGFLEHEPLQKIGREELDCYRLSEDGKDFLEEVFECRIDLRKEINELSLLVEDDEEIISYATSHTPFLSLHKTEKDYVLFNFSKSLYLEKYIECIQQTLGCESIYKYDLKNCSLPILLEDILPWELCADTNPYIYFCDNINSLTQNRHWFFHRKEKGDLIIDRNGNVSDTDSIFN